MARIASVSAAGTDYTTDEIAGPRPGFSDQVFGSSVGRACESSRGVSRSTRLVNVHPTGLAL